MESVLSPPDFICPGNDQVVCYGMMTKGRKSLVRLKVRAPKVLKKRRISLIWLCSAFENRISNGVIVSTQVVAS